MASAKEIALLERKLKSAKTNREKIVLAKELKDLKSKLTTTQKKETLPTQRRKIRMLSSAEFNELIARLKQNPEYSFLKSMGKKKIEDDYRVVGKPVGWRIKGKDNYKVPSKKFRAENPDLVYFENRINRSDVRKPNRLEQGGMMARGGGVDDIREKFEKTTMEVKFKVAIAIGIEDALYYLEKDFVVSPYRLIESAVNKGFIEVDEIDRNLWNSAVSEAEEIDERYKDSGQGIGSSDMNAFISSMLNDAGIKVKVVDGRYERMATGGSLKKKSKETGYIWKINQDIESRSGNNEPTFEVGKIKGYENALKTRSALQEGSPDNFKYSIKATNKYAKGGGLKKKGKSQLAVTSNAVQPKYSDYNVQLVESQDENNKGTYYMFPKPADKNSRGILFEKGGDISHSLDVLWRWSGGRSVYQIIEIINALNDAGITDQDLKTKFSKSNSVNEDRKAKKTLEVWKKAKPYYNGSLEGNQYYQVVYSLIKKANSGETILKDWENNPSYDGDNANVGYKTPNKGDDWRFEKGGEIAVGDWVAEKKGTARGKVYQDTGVFIKLEDKYGNKSTTLYSKRNFKHSVKPRY